MGIVFILLPASLLLATLGVFAFVWAARSRQFDNVEVSAARLLFERDVPIAAALNVDSGLDVDEGPQSCTVEPVQESGNGETRGRSIQAS